MAIISPLKRIPTSTVHLILSLAVNSDNLADARQGIKDFEVAHCFKHPSIFILLTTLLFLFAVDQNNCYVFCKDCRTAPSVCTLYAPACSECSDNSDIDLVNVSA